MNWFYSKFSIHLIHSINADYAIEIHSKGGSFKSFISWLNLLDFDINRCYRHWKKSEFKVEELINKYETKLKSWNGFINRAIANRNYRHLHRLLFYYKYLEIICWIEPFSHSFSPFLPHLNFNLWDNRSAFLCISCIYYFCWLLNRDWMMWKNAVHSNYIQVNVMYWNNKSSTVNGFQYMPK